MWVASSRSAARSGAGRARGRPKGLSGSTRPSRTPWSPSSRTLPERAFELPGGEGDWTVAEAVGHDAAARAGLVIAGSLAASGRWPADAPTVVPGVPGPAAVDAEALIAKLEQSQRIVARAARSIAGHEEDPCPLDHPLVGRLRCGEWLLFAGVHDLMHLEQLHGIADRVTPGEPVGRG